VWVRCDTMLKIIKELDENTELQDIFGNPVSAALTVVAENGDLRIEDGGLAALRGAEGTVCVDTWQNTDRRQADCA